VTQDSSYPRVHPAPMETAGLWPTTTGRGATHPCVHVAGAVPPHRMLYGDRRGPSRTQDPGWWRRTSAASSATSVPIYPGSVCAIVVHRHAAGEVMEGPLGEPVTPASPVNFILVRSPRVRRQESCHPGHRARPTTGPSTALRRRRSPAGSLRRLHTRQLRLEAAYLLDDRRLHHRRPARGLRPALPDPRGATGRARWSLSRHELSMDALELRLKNLLRPEQFPVHDKPLGLRLRQLRADPA